MPSPRQGFDLGREDPAKESGIVGLQSVVASPPEPMVRWSFWLPERNEIQSSPASRNLVQDRSRSSRHDCQPQP